jgi:putative copper export protein
LESWTVIRFLHVAALAFFVGGQLMLVVAVVPAVRRHGSEEAMRSVARRFGAGTLVALAVLVATGVAMASHLSRWQDNVLQIKLMLVVLVGVLLGFHAITPNSRAISIAVLVTSLLIVWLGVELAH